MSSFKEEFQLKNFGFGYDKPYRFSLPEWRWPHGVFVGWRVFWALWHVGWLARSIQDQVSENDGEKWFIYLTNWSYFLLTLQSLAAMVVVLVNTCKGRKTVGDFTEGESKSLSGSGTTTSWLEKLTWLLTSVTFDAAIIVTVMYWTFIFKELTKALSIMTHAVTTLYVLTDIFVSASPSRLLHFVYGSAYGAVYALFTIFYFVGDGTNNEGEPYVYDVIDWSKTGQTIGILGGLILVAVPVVHLFTFGLYTLRVFISQRCSCGKQSTKEGDGMQMA